MGKDDEKKKNKKSKSKELDKKKKDKSKDKKKNKDKKKKNKVKKNVDLRSIILSVHRNIVSQDWEGLKKLFHPRAERYVNGIYDPYLHGVGWIQANQYLWANGTFLKFNFTEPFLSKGQAFFRVEVEYVPHGSRQVFKNIHLIDVRVNSEGLITFFDNYYDLSVYDALAEVIHAARDADLATQQQQDDEKKTSEEKKE